MKEKFPIKYDYFRERLINKDGVYEINFSIADDEDYQDIWMGYSDLDNSYWFGNMSDSEINGYDFETADGILNAKVFHKKSMAELWDKIEFDLINGVSSHTWVYGQCWNIYTACEKDCDKVAKLACELWPHHTFDEMLDEATKVVTSANDVVFLLYCYKEAIAFAHCSIRNDYVEGTHSNPVGYLEGVYVQKEWRNLGFATALIDCCQNWAKSKGCGEFASDCEILNVESIKLHESLGFDEASRLVHFVKELK